MYVPRERCSLRMGCFRGDDRVKRTRDPWRGRWRASQGGKTFQRGEPVSRDGAPGLAFNGKPAMGRDGAVVQRRIEAAPEPILQAAAGLRVSDLVESEGQQGRQANAPGKRLSNPLHQPKPRRSLVQTCERFMRISRVGADEPATQQRGARAAGGKGSDRQSCCADPRDRRGHRRARNEPPDRSPCRKRKA